MDSESYVRRRHWNWDEKRAVVEEAASSGNVIATAKRQDGRRGDLVKVIWHDGQGACLFSKRLERGRFLWPSPADGVVTITPAQFGDLSEGVDWRMPQRSWRPTATG